MPAIALNRPRARQGGYLSKMCHEQIAKDNMPHTYPTDLKDPTSMFLQGLFDGGNDFEAHIGELLAARVPKAEFRTIAETRTPEGLRTSEGKRTKEADTFAAYLDPEVRIIFNPRIGPHFEALLSQFLGSTVSDQDRISEPDLIELGDMMANGLRAMRFIDVKWHKITSGKTKTPKTFPYSDLAAPYLDSTVGQRDFYGTLHNEDWRQLAHYYRHGQTLGVVKPVSSGGAWAGVIGREEIVVWADLDTLTFQTTVGGKRLYVSPLGIYDSDYQAALKVVDNARERDVNPDVEAVAFPEWKTGCAQCPWQTVCKKELVDFGEGGHVTLLAGITPPRALPLYAADIRDAKTLARQDPLTNAAPAEFIYTARVALDGRAHLGLDTTELDLPRGDVEIDFDCENAATVYMWGVRVTDRGTGVVTEHMFDDYTQTEEGELRVFTQTWALFQALIVAAEAAGRTVRLYHYTAYERTQMRALALKYEGKPGVPTVEDVEAFYDLSGAVVDLYAVLSKQIVWPTSSHSIKKLAPFTGFSWRDKTPGGDMSMLWYRTACEDTDPAVRAANMERLREYNLDDVAAQAHLRDWVTAAYLPHVTTLGAPAS